MKRGNALLSLLALCVLLFAVSGDLRADDTKDDKECATDLAGADLLSGLIAATTVGTGAPSSSLISQEAVRRLHHEFREQVLLAVLDEGGGRKNVRFNPLRSPQGHRIEFYTTWTHPRAHRIEVQSRVQIVLSNGVDPKLLGRRVASIKRTGPNRMSAVVYIHPSWIENGALAKNLELLQGLVRSAVVGDKAVHPHILKDARTGKRTPSWVQQKLLARAKELLINSSLDDLLEVDGLPVRAPRIGWQSPGGSGKTFLSGLFFKEFAFLTNSEGQIIQFSPETIVLAVRNTSILDDALPTFKALFNLKDDEILRLYGGVDLSGNIRKGAPVKNTIPADPNLPLTSNAKLILITRDTFHNRLNEIMTWARSRKIGWIMDEAHWLGTASPDGKTRQYEDIVAQLNALPVDPKDPQHVIHLMSATMYHQVPIITNPDLLGYRSADRKGRGKITGSFLTEEEIDRLQREDNVPQISALQLERTMLRGYAPPIHQVGTYSVVDEEGDAINERTAIEGDDGRVHRVNTKDLDAMWAAIKGARRRYEAQRALIVVAGTDRADAIAAYFQKKYGANAEFRALHSKNNDGTQFRWIRDEGSEASDKHKYLIVDGMVQEGSDNPNLNLVVIHRSIRLTTGGIRRVTQIITRVSRVAPFCIDTGVIDYSGTADRVIGDIDSLEAARPSRGGSSSAPGAAIELEDGEITVTADDVPYVEEQNAPSLEDLEKIHAWLIAHAPFADATGKNGKRTSRLAEYLLQIVDLLPSQRVAGKLVLDEEFLRSIRDDELKTIVNSIGREFLENYNTLLDIHRELEALESKTVKTSTDTNDIASYESWLAQTWRHLKYLVLGIDAFQNYDVTVRIAGGRHGNSTITQSDFYERNILALRTKFGPTAIGIKGPIKKDGRDIVFVLSGTMAYSFFRGEAGTHRVTVQERDRPYTRPLQVHVQSSSPDTDVFASAAGTHRVRRLIDSARNQVINDLVAGRKVNLHTEIVATTGRLRLTVNEVEETTQFFDFNQDEYTATLLEQWLIVRLLELTLPPATLPPATAP